MFGLKFKNCDLFSFTSTQLQFGENSNKIISVKMVYLDILCSTRISLFLTAWQFSFIWNKLNESGFRPPLCTYRLNWARRTSWEWWDDWDDTVLQTQDSKFEPWRSEAEHATSLSRRLPTILTFTRGWGSFIWSWQLRQQCQLQMNENYPRVLLPLQLIITYWCFISDPNLHVW